jgi:hypothetical protein
MHTLVNGGNNNDRSRREDGDLEKRNWGNGVDKEEFSGRLNHVIVPCLGRITR